MTDQLKIYNVVLSFAVPGPLYSSLVATPDCESAAAMAMRQMLKETPTDEPLQAVMAQEVSVETLRAMLRLVEGKPRSLSLVKNEPGAGIFGQRAAELLRSPSKEVYTDPTWPHPPVA